MTLRVIHITYPGLAFGVIIPAVSSYLNNWLPVCMLFDERFKWGSGGDDDDDDDEICLCR